MKGQGSEIHGHAVHPNRAAEVGQHVRVVEGLQAVVGQGLRDAGSAAGARAGLRVAVLWFSRRRSAGTVRLLAGQTERAGHVLAGEVALAVSIVTMAAAMTFCVTHGSVSAADRENTEVMQLNITDPLRFVLHCVVI